MNVTIRDLMTDPALFGNQFGGESWACWRALLAGFYGLDLTDDERANFLSLTGRPGLPQGAFDELWLVVGRRGGKTQAAALLAVFEAFFRDHTDKLSPGEVATVMLLAADRKQARSVFRYISGLIDSNPMLNAMVVQGKAPLSLIDWPAADAWHTVLSFESLLRWASWVTPAQHAEALANMADAAKQLIKAETDLLHLNRASQALSKLIPMLSSSEFVRIKNHGEQNQGVMGIRWQAGETLEVAPNDYAQLVGHHGFKRLTETGQFEIMA